MAVNGNQQPPRPRIEITQGAASPEEAAAIAAALEQFLRDTAPAPAPPATGISPWLRAGMYESVGLDPAGSSPWADAKPWGR
ncbi:MAG: hypothetical protein H0T19_04965 [Thermoleophilaceae bacterium]|nr:hypothetical protein [Thermoleophilaceae bacterium]